MNFPFTQILNENNEPGRNHHTRESRNLIQENFPFTQILNKNNNEITKQENLEKVIFRIKRLSMFHPAHQFQK